MNDNEWIDTTTTVPTVFRAVDFEQVEACEDDCTPCAFYYCWQEDLCSPEIACADGRPCIARDRADGRDIHWVEVMP
jgi:hypothetical protein